jgi:hypothetical protein
MLLSYLLFHTTSFGLHAGHHQVLHHLELVATGGYLLNIGVYAQQDAEPKNKIPKLIVFPTQHINGFT